MKKGFIISLIALSALFVGGMRIPLVGAIGQETPTPPRFQPTAQPPISTPRASIPTPFVPVLTPTAMLGDFTLNLEAASNAYYSGNYETALSEINVVLQMSAYNFEALVLRSLIYTAQGEYDLAIADYDDVIRQRGWDWDLIRERAYLHSYKGDYNNAIRDMSIAIDIRPTSSDLFYDRANFYYANAQYEAGDLDYLMYDAINANDIASLLLAAETAETIDPKVGSYALAHIASVYLGQGNYDLCIEYADQALAESPDLGYAYLVRGIAYYETGNSVQAGFDFLGNIQNMQTDLRESSLILGEPYYLDMSYGVTYLMRFSANQGDKLTFSVLGDNVDPMVVLLRANGEAIFGVDDNLNSWDILLENYEMPESGNFTFVVSHAGGAWDGTITLVVSQN